MQQQTINGNGKGGQRLATRAPGGSVAPRESTIARRQAMTKAGSGRHMARGDAHNDITYVESKLYKTQILLLLLMDEREVLNWKTQKKQQKY